MTATRWLSSQNVRSCTTKNKNLASYYESKNQLILDHPDRFDKKVEQVLIEILKPWGFEVTRESQILCIGFIPWDMGRLEIPDDIRTDDCAVAVLPTSQGASYKALLRGDILRGPQDQLELPAKFSRSMVVRDGNEVIVGQAEAFMFSMHLDLSIFRLFIGQHWEYCKHLIPEYYDTSYLPEKTRPISVEDDAVMICLTDDSHSFRLSPRRLLPN